MIPKHRLILWVYPVADTLKCVILSGMERLKLNFFQSEEVVALSKKLLGKYLVSNTEGVRTVGKITEVEAYGGAEDKACHAHLNRFTKRTKVMFMRGGHAYIYLCYGIHHLFNIVTAPEGVPHAVLVRAVEPVEGMDIMQKRRGLQKRGYRLTAGPGVLSQALGLKKSMTGQDMLLPNSPFWIEDRGDVISAEQIVASERIGIDYAEECALWPWRFYLKGNPWVSKR